MYIKQINTLTMLYVYTKDIKIVYLFIIYLDQYAALIKITINFDKWLYLSISKIINFQLF